LIKPNKALIESAINADLSINENGSGQGLRDLSEGKCHIAMISSPLSVVASEMNKAFPGLIKVSDLKVFEVGQTSVVFIVNKENKVERLSKKQLQSILMGDVLNWKQVGGADERIIVFTMPRGDGIRSTVKEKLLNNNFFGVYTVEVKNDAIAKKMVSSLQNAIGMCTRRTLDDTVKSIKIDADLDQTLWLVTKGSPTPKEKALIEEVKKLSKASI